MSISPSTLEKARRMTSANGKSALVNLQEITARDEHELLLDLAQTFSYPHLDMSSLRQSSPAFDVLPFNEAHTHETMVIRDAEHQLWFVFSDPFDDDLLSWANQRINAPFSYALASRQDILAWLHLLEKNIRAMDNVRTDLKAGIESNQAEQISLQAIGADASPIIKLVNSTLYDALMSGASDIHFENDQSGLCIKYRIDGVLNRVAQPAGRDVAEQTISRIKVMAELDIAERRIPQDGRCKVFIKDREVDLRISIMPGVFGEDSVIRILDRQNLTGEAVSITLDQLGFDATTMKQIRTLASEPHGMLLATGPTGSGKTTTLYAAISEINTGFDKIITIEDPVEYQLTGVLQIPVNEKKGLTFSRGLRSILRHDPDKILVGEIRDPETAQIAVQSALTGHLVFTSVHANNVFDVIGRFMHMGVDPYSFVSALNGILAQRLVRLNCPHCLEAVKPDDTLLELSGLTSADVKHYNLQAGAGCGQCRGTGYRGRKAIAEVLIFNDELRELVVARSAIRQIKEAAYSTGMQSLRARALSLVANGETTLNEINRVTFAA
jgi:general secretion pathway protein E